MNFSNQPSRTIYQWLLAKLYLSHQQIRSVLPRGKPSVKPNKSAKRHVGGNNQRWRVPCGITNNCPYKDWRRTHNKGTHQDTPISQRECNVCVVEPQRILEQTPFTDNEIRGICSIDGFRLFVSVQPGRLPNNHGKRPRPSAPKWKVPTKSSAVSKIHRRWRSFEK